ncbi:hypothetical protein T492DRAFT_882659 [Pavlovales sp. CCMP2436]|nr:hypothetical protein T492DRAFT_882659 [Pavlovales sp. CCMP2436]
MALEKASGVRDEAVLELAECLFHLVVELGPLARLTAPAEGDSLCPHARRARRFDILMSEGEESDDPDKLPTRYAVSGEFNKGKLRAADIFQGRKNNLIAPKGLIDQKNTLERFSHFMTSEFRDLANDLKRRATGAPRIIDSDEGDE